MFMCSLYELNKLFESMNQWMEDEPEEVLKEWHYIDLCMQDVDQYRQCLIHGVDFEHRDTIYDEIKRKVALEEVEDILKPTTRSEAKGLNFYKNKTYDIFFNDYNKD